MLLYRNLACTVSWFDWSKLWCNFFDITVHQKYYSLNLWLCTRLVNLGQLPNKHTPHRPETQQTKTGVTSQIKPAQVSTISQMELKLVLTITWAAKLKTLFLLWQTLSSVLHKFSCKIHIRHLSINLFTCLLGDSFGETGLCSCRLN